MKVNEIFYSLQGEGARAGEPSIFIRLAECNLTCNFCDTEFNSYKEMSLEEIKTECLKYPSKWIIWTGGEPSLQLTHEIVEYFKEWKQAIETNGTNKVPENLDWVCVSPKVAEHVLKRNFTKVNELKYILHTGKQIPKPVIESDNYYLSPMSDGDKINKENLNHCIKLCLENPVWKLTLQSHKIWGVK